MPLLDEEDSLLATNGYQLSERDSIIRLLIEGKVQSVGYRQWMCMQAKKLNVNGWVRNRTNGKVEALLAGKETAVRELIRQAYQGPSFCHVKKLTEFPMSKVEYNLGEEFTQLPTI